MATAPLDRPYADVEELFRNCVVRISARGTGFFVAPDRILTCAHLFGDGDTFVSVIWHHKKGTAKVHSLCSKETPEGTDLAMLEVSWDGGEQVNHPCVMLMDGAGRGDQFTTFGHPTLPGTPNRFEEGGDTLSFVYSGLSADRFGTEYTRASGERTIGGFSGSPVLNLRTREVCGVLAMSVNTAAAEGGRFLPARLAFEGFPDVCKQQKAYHEQDPTWSNFLPGTQLWAEVRTYTRGSIETFERVFGPEANDNVPFVGREIETAFATFVANNCSAMVIKGQSGMGKTTLIQRLLSTYEQQGHLCTVFESVRLPFTIPEVERYILDRFGRNETTAREFWAKISPECVKRGKCLLVFVDAVNEYNSGRASGAEPFSLLEKLDVMITSVFTDYPNIKFVITCRPETWTRAKSKALTLFADNRKEYYPGPRGIAHELPRFSEAELEAAYENYRRVKKIVTSFAALSSLARYQLRDPLLLSLAADVYNGEKIPEDLDTGEVFDKYYLRLETSHSTIQGIVSEFFAPSSGGNAPDTIIRTTLVRDSKLKERDPKLYEKLDMTNTDSVGFQLKKQKVLREWTIQPEENKIVKELEIQIRFTYDRFAEFLLSQRLLQMIAERTRRENAAIDVIVTNLMASQQMAIVFEALRRTLFALQKQSGDYAALLEGITRSDPRGLPLVSSVLATTARNAGGIDVIRKLFKRFKRSFRMKEGPKTRFPLIDVVYRMLRNEEYRLWMEERPEERSKHLELLDGYFHWGFKHRDKKVSANAVLYLYFLWRGDAQFAFPDAHRITQGIVAQVRRTSLLSYLFHWEQVWLLPNIWGLLVILAGELSEADRPECALETFRQMIRNLKLRDSLAFRLIRPILPLNAALWRYLRRALKNLDNPVNLASLDALFAAPNYESNLAHLEEIMSFFAPTTSPAEIEKHARELSLVENGFILEMLTLAISACYERQDSQGQKHCLALLKQLFNEPGAAATTQYCASLALYHINYFGTKATKESLELMGAMAETILKERTGRFELLGKRESFNIIGTYGRALYKNGKILDDGTGRGTTKLALQYAIVALQQAKEKKDFGYYLFVCENIGLLGVLIEPKQVLELISTVLNDFQADPNHSSSAPFSPEQMAEAYKTVLMSLANIRVIYRQVVDRFLLDELESSGLYQKIVQEDPKLNLATFYSWSFEQLMFRVLTKFSDPIGRAVVEIFLQCARSGSTKACLKVVVDRVITRLNELSQ